VSVQEEVRTFRVATGSWDFKHVSEIRWGDWQDEPSLRHLRNGDENLVVEGCEWEINNLVCARQHNGSPLQVYTVRRNGAVSSEITQLTVRAGGFEESVRLWKVGEVEFSETIGCTRMR